MSIISLEQIMLHIKKLNKSGSIIDGIDMYHLFACGSIVPFFNNYIILLKNA